jgi:hypothetical protein
VSLDRQPFDEASAGDWSLAASTGSPQGGAHPYAGSGIGPLLHAARAVDATKTAPATDIAARDDAARIGAAAAVASTACGAWQKGQVVSAART